MEALFDGEVLRPDESLKLCYGMRREILIQGQS